MDVPSEQAGISSHIRKILMCKTGQKNMPLERFPLPYNLQVAGVVERKQMKYENSRLN